MEKNPNTEINCVLESLRQSIVMVQEEYREDPQLQKEGVRYMREGVGVLLDAYGEMMPEYIWLNPNLRFVSSNVSLERVEEGRINPIDETPGGILLWDKNIGMILNRIEVNLNR